MPRVRVQNGALQGKVFEIEQKPIVVGRDPTCEIQIQDKGVSRRHAEIFLIDEMCFLRDLDSRNGSFVNGAKADEELLRAEDIIQIGATLLVFESGSKDSIEFAVESEEKYVETATVGVEDLPQIQMPMAVGERGEARRLRMLYDLSRIISRERDPEALTREVLKLCCDQVSADEAYLFVPNPQKGNIVPLGSYKRNDRKGSKISRTIIRRVLTEKRAVLTSDAMHDDRFESGRSVMLKQIRSVLSSPLFAGGECCGVLYLATDAANQTFAQDDMELVVAIGDLVGFAIENLRIRREHREQIMGTIRFLMQVGEMRDPTTRGQSVRVATYAAGIALQMGLPEAERANVQLAGLLHDLGRLTVDERSLLRVGREITPDLDAEEACRRATIEIIRKMAWAPQVLDCIRFMRERYRGQGPEGLSGDEIPLGARILAVAEEFDRRANRLSNEPPKERLNRAVIGIGHEGGSLFDPAVVKALLIAHRNGILYTERPEVADTDIVVDPRKMPGR
ncbi:MAG: HD domain-containing phosphohydrolase [Planctomycetota bacterium]